MTILRRFVVGALTVGALLQHPYHAVAATCSSSVASKCWKDHSGPNYALVTSSAGAVFATRCASDSTCNRVVETYKPSGTTAASTANPYLMNQVSGITNPFTGTHTIRSMTAHRTYPVVPYEAGPTLLYALRSDGRLYVSAGDTRFRNSSDYFGKWVLVATPKDTSGQSVTLRSVTTLHIAAPYPDSYHLVLALSTSNRLYQLSGGAWAPASPPNAFRLVYGAPAVHGILVLNGTSTSTKKLDLAAASGPIDFPDIPSGVTLSGAGYGFVEHGTMQPFAIGIHNAFFLKETTSLSNFIYRTQVVGGAWTPWQVYDTGTLDGAGVETPCWNIVDGFTFRKRNGELFCIGDNFHLFQYVP